MKKYRTDDELEKYIGKYLLFYDWVDSVIPAKAGKFIGFGKCNGDSTICKKCKGTLKFSDGTTYCLASRNGRVWEEDPAEKILQFIENQESYEHRKIQNSDEELEKRIGEKIIFFDGYEKIAATGIFLGFKECRWQKVKENKCNRDCRGMVILKTRYGEEEICARYSEGRRWKVATKNFKNT
jgi:hypothetical protein